MSSTSDAGVASGPVEMPAGPLMPFTPYTPRLRGRWIVEPKDGGWNDYALSEWELIGAGYSDLHPHDEVTYVLAGQLHIEVDGVTSVGRTGDTITVPAGRVGRYFAPHYARMLGVYGPNPEGAESQDLGYWEIDPE